MPFFSPRSLGGFDLPIQTSAHCGWPVLHLADPPCDLALTERQHIYIPSGLHSSLYGHSCLANSDDARSWDEDTLCQWSPDHLDCSHSHNKFTFYTKGKRELTLYNLQYHRLYK